MSTATFVFMIATFYVGGSAPMEGGKYLANGQIYDNKEYVAAHRTLPFGTSSMSAFAAGVSLGGERSRTVFAQDGHRAAY